MEKLLPYRIAALCFLFDGAGNTLLLRRSKPPNKDLYSPIGGKLEMGIGESPTACAVRETYEETGLILTAQDLHLTGIVSEKAFEGEGNWMMFLYEVIKPVQVEPGLMDEGILGWYDINNIMDLNIPVTDRKVIWPMFWKYRRKFFCAHIDCSEGKFDWQLEQSEDN